MRAASISLMLLTAGCSQAPAVPNIGSDQSAEIEALKDQVGQLRKDLTSLAAARNTWANLRVNDKGFSFIDAGGFPLAVSLEDVTESASGSKIKLKIGNPTTADIRRLRLFLSYGKSTDDGLLTEPIHSKEEAVSTTLENGVWSEVTIGLPNAPPRELGIVRIDSALVESVSLARR